MRKTIRFLLLLAALPLLILALAVAGWMLIVEEYYRIPPVSFTRVEAERSNLTGPFESYMSVEEATAIVRALGYDPEVRRVEWAGERRVPRMTLETIALPGYRDAVCDGDLELEFANDRLAAVRLYPSDVADCAVRTGAPHEPGTAAVRRRVPPHTEVLIYLAHRKTPYVSWSDERLDREFELWVRRYS